VCLCQKKIIYLHRVEVSTIFKIIYVFVCVCVCVCVCVELASSSLAPPTMIPSVICHRIRLPFHVTCSLPLSLMFPSSINLIIILGPKHH
jgi:hypothetical protein